MKGGGYGILCGSFGSESIVVRVQAGRGDVCVVLEGHFLNTSKSLLRRWKQTHETPVHSEKSFESIEIELLLQLNHH